MLESILTLHMGNETYKVKKGESFYFLSLRSHAWGNEGARRCVVIWVVSPPSL